MDNIAEDPSWGGGTQKIATVDLERPIREGRRSRIKCIAQKELVEPFIQEDLKKVRWEGCTDGGYQQNAIYPRRKNLKASRQTF